MSGYKIAVITANCGDFDDVHEIPPQDVEFDRFYITEKNVHQVTGFPFTELRKNNRMLAKYFKVQSHKIWRSHNIHIWLDARVKVTSNKFVSNYILMLEDGASIITTSHPERDTISHEFDYMIKNKEIQWMRTRYDVQDTIARRDFMLKYAPKDLPLFSAGISARWDNEENSVAYDEWWDLIQQFNHYDQVFYSYVIWRRKLDYKTIPYHNDFFKVLNHR